MKKSGQYYNSIDTLPCFNFDKVISTGDYTHLYIEGAEQTLQPDELENLWLTIYDEFIKEFGISEQYKAWLEQMGLYVQCLDAAYNGGDRTQLTFAEINKRRADELIKKNDNNISIYAVVSKFMGFPCKAKELSVKEFYGYLKLASLSKE